MDANLWDPFIANDYETAARRAADVLRESHALDAIHVAGLSLVGLNRITEGMDWICASLSLASAKPDWFANAAIVMFDKKQWPLAHIFLDNGTKEHPDNTRLQYMSGLCAVHQHRWSDAIAFFNKVLEMEEGFYHARLSKGFCLHMLGELELALECYESIKDATPQDQDEVENNIACVYLEQNRHEEAIKLLKERCVDQSRPGTLYNLSLLYLCTGEWEKGWELYKYRETVDAQNKFDHLETKGSPAPSSLDDIKNKKYFVMHEQGFGDSLMLARYLPMVGNLAKEVTYGVPEKLKRVMETLDMPCQFRVITDSSIHVDCDMSSSMADLPGLFHTTPDNIPANIPYFKVPKDVLLKRALPPTGKKRIGLCWSGASRPDHLRAHSIDRRRSIPFDMMKPILESDSYDFTSLQLSDNHLDHQHLRKFLDDDFDVLDTCAVIQQLDLVITIDSAVAHMAGALGVPTWLLCRFDGCWRWRNAETTGWYPSMRIFRQPERHAWGVVIEHVCDELGVYNKQTLVA